MPPKSQLQSKQQDTTSSSTPSTVATSVIVLRCVLCRKPVEIIDPKESSSNNNNSASSPTTTTTSSKPSITEQAANLLFKSAITTSQDFPLCSQCWQHRHITTQQTTLTELSSLVETLNSVDAVNPTALAAFQGVELAIDPLTHEYVAKLSQRDEEEHENAKNSEADEKVEAEFAAEKARLLAQMADLEKKLLSKRSQVLSLQQDLSRFKQDEDAIDRKQNGLFNEEIALHSSAQSATTRLQTAKAGFARLGLSAAEGAALVQATFASHHNSPTHHHQNSNPQKITSVSAAAAATTASGTSSSSKGPSSNLSAADETINSIFANISSLGSCLGAAYTLEIDDLIPRINGRRVGRLPNHNVSDDEINSGCGFLALLMHHFLQAYTKMEKTGCSMEPAGCFSTISVFVPKKTTVDFHIKRKFFSWSTFGQAWVVFANCVLEVVTSILAMLRLRAQKHRQSAGFSTPGSNIAALVTRIDEHISAVSSLPRITASTGNPAAKVDDNSVKYGDASDTQWTNAVHGLFRSLKWCVEAEKFLAE